MELNDTEMMIGLGGLAVTAIGAWWLKNRSKVVAKIEDIVDDVEEAIEEATGLDVDLSEVVDEAMENCGRCR